MGTSTDAIVYWGFEVGEDTIHPLNDNPTFERSYEWDDVYAEKKGLVRPEFVRRNEPGFEEYDKADDEYREAKVALVDPIGCTIDHHCHIEHPMHYVAVEASVKCANRGYPEELEDDALKVGEDWREKLQEFCRVLGIEFKEPKWHLVSYWG